MLQNICKGKICSLIIKFTYDVIMLIKFYLIKEYSSRKSLPIINAFYYTIIVFVSMINSVAFWKISEKQFLLKCYTIHKSCSIFGWKSEIQFPTNKIFLLIFEQEHIYSVGKFFVTRTRDNSVLTLRRSLVLNMQSHRLPNNGFVPNHLLCVYGRRENGFSMQSVLNF